MSRIRSENIFNNQLNDKYPTKLHLADKIFDRIKKIDRSESLSRKTESSFEWISMLNQIDNRRRPTKKQVQITSCETYLNECLRVAERLKNCRSSERNRRIFYENFLLAEKLQNIRKENLPNPIELDHCSTTNQTLDFRKSSSRNDDEQLTEEDVDSTIESTQFTARKRHVSKLSDRRAKQESNDRLFEHYLKTQKKMAFV